MTGHPREDLGAYALGVLDPPEQRAVEDHLASCASCRAELALHGEALWAIAEGAATTPPDGLRERIVRRATSARRASAPLRLLFRPLPALVPLALAAVLAVTVVGLAGARRDADTYARALAGVASGSVVALTATPEGAGARGSLVVPASGRPYLVLDLPSAPAGRTWEAWIIRGQSVVPAGLADPRSGVLTIVLTQPLSVGDTVAVTLEDARGAEKPTTAPVLTGRT